MQGACGTVGIEDCYRKLVASEHQSGGGAAGADAKFVEPAEVVDGVDLRVAALGGVSFRSDVPVDKYVSWGWRKSSFFRGGMAGIGNFTSCLLVLMIEGQLNRSR